MVTSPYTALFGKNGFKPKTATVPSCPADKAKPYLPEPKHRPMPMADSFVTSVGVCLDDDTGKPWLVVESVCWNPLTCEWVCNTEGVMPVPVMIKASSADAVEDSEFTYLPSFDGFIEVYTTGSTDPVRLYGSSKIPTDMIGAIFCFGEAPPCYVGSQPNLPIPDEVQIGGDMPAEGSDVELWVDNGIPKTLGPDGWVQTTNYGK